MIIRMVRYCFSKDYRSPPQRPGVLARRFPGGCFYVRVAGVVLRAYWYARRGAYTDKRWIRDSHAILRAVESVGISIEVANPSVFGRLDGPCVIVGNHMSTAETFLLPGIVCPFQPVTFIVKRSLMRYPIFKHVMLSRTPVVVGRENPRDDLRAVLEEGAQRIADGVSVVVFPQTTRSPVFDPARFNSIGVKLARRAGVPVIPLALKTDAWGNGRWFKDVGPIDPGRTMHIAFGEPLQVAGSGRDIHGAVVAFIAEHLESWGGTIARDASTAGS